MSGSPLIPFIPDNAPFTPEQRAYLNGFLAGLFSRAPQPDAGSSPAPAAPLVPLTILFGSQTGTCEGLAKRAAKEAGRRGFVPTVQDMAGYDTSQLARETNLLVIASTYGDGDPPDSAKGFWEWLSGDQAPAVGQLRFSVCALGDTNYSKFCAFGKNLDARLAKLGAQCVQPRVDCDLDYEPIFAQWIDGALNSLSPSSAAGQKRAEEPSQSSKHAAETTSQPKGYDRNNPFPGALLGNHRLNSPGSAKDTRHLVFSLDGSGLNYEAGDALGVQPSNCPQLVEDLLAALKCSGDEPVVGRAGSPVALRDALLRHYEITRTPTPFLKAMAERTGDPTLLVVSADNANGELTRFLRGRELIDLLLAHPQVSFSAEQFVALLKKLQPRLYSISSSPKAHPGEVHLTVAIVRYESLGRPRKGVCSTFLADRVPAGESVPIFVHPNRAFRPPADSGRRSIMVGPGTGVAPFRAFLEERRATGATGANWLFFGDQHAETDFLYRNELESMRADGTLARLDTAFSRDQSERIYVQNRMLEQAGELFAWLEDGAHFYVCGDASRMAKDVDQALHEVVSRASGCSPEVAAQYVKKLQAEKRYQRDVY